MHVQKIAEPGGGGPGFLRIPGPVVTPGLFGPEGTHHYAHCDESPAHAHQGVAEAQVALKGR